MKRVRLKIIVNLNLIFIYTTTINKQVLHLILISLLVTDVSARVSLIWEERGVPLGTHVSKGDQISVAAVRSECIVHYATWTQIAVTLHMYKEINCAPPPPRGLVTIFYRMESTPSTLTLLIRTRLLLKQQYVKDEYRITQC